MGVRALAIDFGRRPRRGGGWLGLVLLAAGTALAGLSLQRYLDAGERVDDARSRLERLARRAAGASAEPVVDPELRRLLGGAARVAGELRRPWPALFADVEGALDGTVALLALEPDPGKRQLRLIAEARTLADALAYTERLGATGSLANARIVQQEARLSEGIAALGFTVVADWREAGP